LMVLGGDGEGENGLRTGRVGWVVVMLRSEAASDPKSPHLPFSLSFFSDALIVDVSAIIYILVLAGVIDSRSKTIITMVCFSSCSQTPNQQPGESAK
jgi:hypothetical protein